MKHDSLGDRMKDYESRSQFHLPRRTYTMLRLDGKSFHNYTKDCQRPYDLGLMSDMDNTAKHLCENIQGCKLAYVQSDEITLVLTDFDTIQTDAWFDGNVQKITSISASMATAKFNALRTQRALDDYSQAYIESTGKNAISFDHMYTTDLQKLAYFDSRCWVIPDPVEIHNCILWRMQDCTRNSIQMTGQAHFSHKQLQNKSCDNIQEMLWSEKGINWNDMPGGFKRGRCVVKQTYEEPNLYKNDGTFVTRTKWVVEVPPILSQEPDWIWKHVPRM